MLEDKGTFLTCGDDKTLFEFSIKDKALVREGRVWTYELYGGKAYSTEKIKSTASTMGNAPVHQQSRCITYSSKHDHLAVSNNYGDVAILDYKDWTKRITTLYKPREWCEVMAASQVLVEAVAAVEVVVAVVQAVVVLVEEKEAVMELME